ncbi:MAG TPA: ComEC/Rec2 family competence protein [Solirubrobacterales bacterium]|nr:ComEC/Rec2 family competence protein [Solirubrobacterales bacterium]HNA23247.1 ComEC/Rec2 family competence protein [Solirubrobacterales bacterium]HNI39279.1 ComEC/Rec2 family competence protein [Solirubrobacterales bacterium]HNK34207.1 ComEC/Rec2 family competence protein [Solirubrobacterales bacterium]HNK65305.1 ComEC/Rec2 family competence protein [Solirubrobacterales bacterium]
MNTAADWRLAAAIGGAAGLAASPFLGSGGSWLKPALAAALAIGAFSHRGRLSGVGLLLVTLAAAIAGLLLGGARIDAIDAGALRAPAGATGLSGFVDSPPSHSQGISRFDFETGEGKVLVETSSPTDGLLPGRGLEVSGELGPSPDWMAADLERRGIAMVLRADRLRPDGLARGGVTGLIDRLRENAFEALAVAVPEQEAALSRGFVLGDDGEVDERTTEDFRNSGLSHLLAVSGQNVVLLALLAIPFLSLIGARPRQRLLVIAGLILIYIPLAGGGPSIQRAGVMGLAGLAALAATRAPSRAYALAIAALVTLGLNPRATGDIGWQLSFVAVIGIMLLARPLQLRLEPVVGSEGWRRSLAEGIAVTLAATIVTAPLIAFHFERLPVGTLAANLVAMPAVAPAMWLGMISVAVGQLSPVLAAPFNLAGSLFLGWIAQVAEWFGRPEWAVIEVSPGSALNLALISVALVLVIAAVLRFWRPGQAPVRPGRWLPAAVLVLACLILLVPGLTGSGRRHLDAPPPGGARVEILDVGQGDAILIRPSGADPILIDGGPPGGGISGALESAGVSHLAAAILTHPHLDHYGGLLDLFGLIPVDRLLYDRAPAELLALAEDSGAELDRVNESEEIRDGDLSLEILWPPAQGPTGEAAGVASGDQSAANENSIVTLLRWRGFRMLLTGDAEEEAVPLDPGPIDVLKVAHHGSEDAGLPALLDESSPRLAVISVGEDNRYGHPAADALSELSADGVETLRTDRDGTVSIVLGAGPGYRVETGR